MISTSVLYKERMLAQRGFNRWLIPPAALATADNAIKTPQFWLLWVVLCANVTAEIGVLSQASPMIQEMFKVSAATGAGFVVLLSV